MKPIRSLVGPLLLVCVSPAWSEDIGQVMERSQQTLLGTLPEAAADTRGAAQLRDSFERLLPLAPSPADARLRVVSAGAVAETLAGRVVVMNAALGELPEICRLFLIAHELGHVMQDHWAKRIALYRRFIPGEVVQAQTDAVADQLGPEASMQSHQQEYEADAYAMRTLLDLGYSRDELLEMFFHLGRHGTTATHPSTGQRLAQLRQIDEQRRLAAASPNSHAQAAR
jgi:Peptidase family M48